MTVGRIPENALIGDDADLPICNDDKPGGAYVYEMDKTTPGVWYKILGTGGTLTVSICTKDGFDITGAADFDTIIHVYEGSCEELICVDGNDDYTSPETRSSCGVGSVVSWSSELNKEYWVRVSGFKEHDSTLNVPSFGNFEMVITPGGGGGGKGTGKSKKDKNKKEEESSSSVSGGGGGGGGIEVVRPGQYQLSANAALAPVSSSSPPSSKQRKLLSMVFVLPTLILFSFWWRHFIKQ